MLAASIRFRATGAKPHVCGSATCRSKSSLRWDRLSFHAFRAIAVGLDRWLDGLVVVVLVLYERSRELCFAIREVQNGTWILSRRRQSKNSRALRIQSVFL